MGERADRDPVPSEKKAYEKPAVIHSEKVLARCVTCASSTPEQCGPNGPLLGS